MEETIITKDFLRDRGQELRQAAQMASAKSKRDMEILANLIKVPQPSTDKYVIQAGVVEVREDIDGAFIAQVAVENQAEHS